MSDTKQELGEIWDLLGSINKRLKSIERKNNVMTELRCPRCGQALPEKYRPKPILGQIKDLFQLIVEDENSKEAVFYCHSCKKLFICPIGIYIRIIP
jgi:hypothetical protein